MAGDKVTPPEIKDVATVPPSTVVMTETNTRRYNVTWF